MRVKLVWVFLCFTSLGPDVLSQLRCVLVETAELGVSEPFAQQQECARGLL